MLIRGIFKELFAFDYISCKEDSELRWDKIVFSEIKNRNGTKEKL